MKKYLLTFLIFVLALSANVFAQETWVPFLRWQTDNNPTDKKFVVVEGQHDGDHRFADGTNKFAYHINLEQFKSVNQIHPLYLKFNVWNEYAVRLKEGTAASADVSDGEVIADFVSPGFDVPDTFAVDLSFYYNLGVTDVVFTFFDNGPREGHGPSCGFVGLYYKDDAANIPDTKSNVVLGNIDYITVDGNVDEWDAETKWNDVKKSVTGVTTVGTVADDADLSATAAMSLDKDKVYFAFKVTDNTVNEAGDSVVFYLGTYDLTEKLNTRGHLNYIAGTDTFPGYRNHKEPDYRFVVNVNETSPVLYESSIFKGVVTDGKVVVKKTTDGYIVEGYAPFAAMHISGVTNAKYQVNEDNYLPFAFKVMDSDAAGVEGSLITGGEDVDVNPNAWAFKSNILDNSTATEGDGNILKGLMATITPGLDDQNYWVAAYNGGHDDNHRWADANDSLGFHFDIDYWMKKVPNQTVYIDFRVKNEYVVSVGGSVTGPKEEFAVWSTKGLEVHDGSNVKDVEISLDDMNARGYYDLHVVFTDGIPATGWGPSLDRIRIYYKGLKNDVELYSFTPGNDATNGDADYLVADNGSGADGSHRWTDGTSSFGYKFDLAAIKAGTPADKENFFNVFIENTWIIKVAETETGTPVEVARWDSKGVPVTDGSNAAWVNLSLKPYIVDSNWSSVVFFFSDGKTDDGWGGALRHATVTYRDLLGYYMVEEFIASTANEVEAVYLVPNFEGESREDQRFFDGNNIGIYKFNKTALMAKSGGVDNLLVKMSVNNEYVISVNSAADTTGQTQLFIWSPTRTPEHSGGNREYKEINLKTYFDQGWEDVYVILQDGLPNDGWGPSLTNVQIFSLKSVTIGVKDGASTVPQNFELSQNYPNPFNPITNISYSLPKQANISLIIYDILGREVKTLVNNMQNAGNYKITWKGDNNFGQKVASGVYLYRMLINNAQQQTKKMIMLK